MRNERFFYNFFNYHMKILLGDLMHILMGRLTIRLIMCQWIRDNIQVYLIYDFSGELTVILTKR